MTNYTIMHNDGSGRVAVNDTMCDGPFSFLFTDYYAAMFTGRSLGVTFIHIDTRSLR
jgi:hypothetical protein